MFLVYLNLYTCSKLIVIKNTYREAELYINTYFNDKLSDNFDIVEYKEADLTKLPGVFLKGR